MTSGRIRNHDPMPSFPDDFLWGTATSAYQIEGSPPPTGRACPSGTRSPTPRAKILTGETGTSPATTTADGEQDLDLLAEIGCTGYRFSISWPRILPEAPVRSKAGAGLLRQVGRRVGGSWHQGLPTPVSLGPPAGPAGQRRLVRPRHRSRFRGLRPDRRPNASVTGTAAFITLNEPSVHTRSSAMSPACTHRDCTTWRGCSR